MVRWRTFALTAILILGGTMPHAQEPLSLEDWLGAARQHTPGAWDDSARRVAPLKAADLRALSVLLDSQFGPRAPQVLGRDNILLAGAVLHADVAMLSSYRASSGPGEGFVITAMDGRNTGREARDPGWEFARHLLDAVSPEPTATRVVRLWYRATTAHMARSSRFGYAEPQLVHARRLFPNDAGVLCDSGWLFEQLAGPRVQAVVAELAPPPTSRLRLVNVPSPGEALKTAESFLTQAIEADPSLAEARLRRGRVRSLRGHQEDAIDDLTHALQSEMEPFLRYYAELFLGGAYEAAGQAEAARRAYQRAAALFPLAQSPHLALSRLATGRGDMAGAQRHLQPLWPLSPSGANREDPWWSYQFGSGRHVDDMLRELYVAAQTLGGGSQWQRVDGKW